MNGEQVKSYFKRKYAKMHQLHLPVEADTHQIDGSPTQEEAEGDPDRDYLNDPNFPTLEDELQNDIVHESKIFDEESHHKRRHQKHKTMDKGSSSKHTELH